MNSVNDEKIYGKAKKRVAFRRHLLVYILVNAGIIVIWYLVEYLNRDPDPIPQKINYWFLYPLAGWGIGLAFHYWNTFHDDDASVDREFNKIKKQLDKKDTQITNPDNKIDPNLPEN